jgi:hypothetical protein
MIGAEAEGHVVSRERAAVMEDDTLAQRQVSNICGTTRRVAV